MTTPNSRIPAKRTFAVSVTTLRANSKPLPAWRRMTKCAMKHMITNHTGAIPLLISVLEKSQDQHIWHFAILIMEKMLFHKSDDMDHAQIFALHGAVDHLLKIIIKYQQNWSDDFICSLFRVTTKIAEEDKKFPVKARFLGVLSVIITYIKNYSKKHKVLNTILRLLKKILASSVNATKLSKDGLPRELLRFLDSPKKSTIMPVLEAISEATRARYAARYFIKDDVISRVLQILFNTNPDNINKNNSTYGVCKTSLRILVHLTQIKIGREKLSSTGAIPSLLAWSHTLLNILGTRYDCLVSLVSTVIQRCLPIRAIPVRKLSNPIVFTFSESFYLNESDNSEGRNDDTLSLASSNFSSADSGTDSEEEIRLLTEPREPQDDESMQKFSVFFDELKDFTQANPSEEQRIENMQSNLCDKVLSSPILEVKEMRTNIPIAKFPQRHSSLPVVRKEVIRKLRKPHVESFILTRDKATRSSLLGTSHLNGQINFTKNSHKLPPTESPSHDVNEIMCLKSEPNYKMCQLSEFERGHLLESAREERKNQKFLENVSLSEVYQKQASSTISVSPFVKLAYPDVNSCLINGGQLIKLLEPNPFLLRREIYKHTEQMVHGDLSYLEIYNLDNLVSDSIPNPSGLNNTDGHQIYSDYKSDHLIFEARFESGNLRKVFWKGTKEYDIILNPDINSKSHLQWFYFEVSGMEANCPYTFNIINMEKPTSQFNEGMCPVMLSVRNNLEKKQGWTRVGSNICYYKNHYTQGPSTNSVLRNKPYYTLTFTVVFPHKNDVCYLAYHYPYTFSLLQTHIYCWMNSYDKTSIYLKNDELCKTLSGNSVPLLTITAQPIDGNRPYIFLTARIHPGESNSSWVMKGSLDFLLSNKPSAQRLREMYIFKVVPMLNPDGVINGCHRCSLTGQDLNRQWISPNVHLHPTIFYTKSLISYLYSKNRKPQVFCDYHGHSRRSNVFFYGCNPEQTWLSNTQLKQDCESFKILPILMQQIAPTFSLEDCQFTVERCRESTGRVTVWRQYDVALSYTMECSYGGCDQGLYAGYHLGIPQLEETGMKLCQCFGKLVLNSENGQVTSSLPLDLKSFPIARSNKTTRTKFCTSSTSESEDDFEDCDDDEFI